MIQAKNQPFSIERPVGERETNRSDDLEAVRNALAERGLCQRTVTGQWNAKFKPDLTAGIRIFQRQSGLDPDGLVVPGGPTALALAFGGEVQVRARTPTGGPEMASFCRGLKRQVDAARREVAQINAELTSSEQELRGIASELNAALAELRLSPATGAASLSRILRELDNFPDPDHPAIRVVRRLISELRKVGLDVTDIKIELAAAVKNRLDLEADFARDCIGR